jgi:hypothetical protein
MTATATTPDLALFLHALASEFDEQAGAPARDALLRAVGQRMAARVTPPPCQTVDALEIEINDLLARLGWGHMSLEVLRNEHAVKITHHNLPRLGALGDVPGQWLAATLEGLYETWFSQQPGAVSAYTATREKRPDPNFRTDVVALRLTLEK